MCYNYGLLRRKVRKSGRHTPNLWKILLPPGSSETLVLIPDDNICILWRLNLSALNTEMSLKDLIIITFATYQKKRPIFWIPSNTKIPVGVRPREYSHPSLPCNYHTTFRETSPGRKLVLTYKYHNLNILASLLLKKLYTNHLSYGSMLQ